MLSTHQLLQSMLDMQKNAQQNLPVIPNNGNPAGANNMPQRQGNTQQQSPLTGGTLPAHQQGPTPMTERYPWLKPSGSMDNIRGYLDSRRERFGQSRLPPQASPPIQGQMQTMAVDPADYPISLPPMPIRAETY